MESYGLKCFTADEFRAMKLAERVVDLLPDAYPDGELVRCHEVARVVDLVVRKFFGRQVLWVQDGHYGYCDHTWLWTREPESRSWVERPDRLSCPNILDPYAVGSLPQVRLVDCSATALPHFGLMYRNGPAREDVRGEWVEEWTRRVLCSDMIWATVRRTSSTGGPVF